MSKDENSRAFDLSYWRWQARIFFAILSYRLNPFYPRQQDSNDKLDVASHRHCSAANDREYGEKRRKKDEGKKVDEILTMTLIYRANC